MTAQEFITMFMANEREYNLTMDYERLENTLRHIANMAHSEGYIEGMTFEKELLTKTTA